MAKLSEHYVLSFCRNLSGQKVIKLQYDTVEISKLNQMVPAKYSSEICIFFIKYNGAIIRGTMPYSRQLYINNKQ